MAGMETIARKVQHKEMTKIFQDHAGNRFIDATSRKVVSDRIQSLQSFGGGRIRRAAIQLPRLRSTGMTWLHADVDELLIAMLVRHRSAFNPDSKRFTCR